MARNQIKVYLGFEDEYINDKNKCLVNFTSSKIGGKPDWPFFDVEPDIPCCTLCGLSQLLVVQIYAPLDNSPYHRTLYIFACINPNCWNQNESWTCLRSQQVDQSAEVSSHAPAATISKGITATEWVQDADDWGDDTNDNISEENGNLINMPNSSPTGGQNSDLDDEDESYSMEESLRAGLEELCVDNKNANNGGLLVEAQAGAVGRLQSPTATAEIEGEESEVVSIDTPTVPQRNILALLQEVAPLPADLCQKNGRDSVAKLEFSAAFISVGEEDNNSSPSMTEHIRELINEYQLQNEGEDFTQEPTSSARVEGDTATLEKYEKATPAHGDKMFHYFISKIQTNPGQIIRYSRGHPMPLLIAPVTELPNRCQYCKNDMIFEMQVMPTLIPKLHLTNTGISDGTHVEFGTVLIFTCERSCWNSSDSFRQEMVIVQNERI